MSSKGGPITKMRTTIINRSSVPSGHSSSMTLGGGGGGYGTITRQSMRMSYGAPSFAHGTLSDISHTGVTEIVDTRAKEKHEMQSLNERFAGYIEKVRFLEAQNKALIMEIERLKGLKGFDASEIKNMYEQEIKQMREIIQELTQEKAGFDTKLCSLEDQLEEQKRERIEAEKIAQQLRNDMDTLNSQIGECEGELASIRGRCGMLEEENKRLKEKIDRLEGQLASVRNDLDEETQKRLIAENELQMLREQYELSKGIFDAEVEQYKQLLEKDKTVEIRDVWRNELKKCIAEIQREYDDKLGHIKAEYETKMETQMRQLQAGVNRDNIESLQAREESKKLKSKMGDFGRQLADLEAENKRLRSALAQKENEYDDLQQQTDEEISRLQFSLNEVRAQLELVLQELQSLQDIKMSLELEISCYRKLLEGEESKLSAIVQEASGARSKGADALADMISQQSRGGRGGGDSYSMNEAQGKMTIQKSSRGPIAICECSIDGSYIELENTKSKAQNLKGWKLVRTGTGKGGRVNSYEFGDINLNPGQSIRVFGKTGKEMQEEKFMDNDVVGTFSMWGSGSCEVKLLDNSGAEKATLNCRFNM